MLLISSIFLFPFFREKSFLYCGRIYIKVTIVLAPWAAITKISQTGKLVNNRNYFLTVLEAEKFRIKVPADLVSDENLLLDHRLVLSPRKGWERSLL